MNNIINWFYTFILGIDYQNMVDKVPVNTAILFFCIFYSVLAVCCIKLTIGTIRSIEDKKGTIFTIVAMTLLFIVPFNSLVTFIVNSVFKYYFFAVVFLIFLLALDITLICYYFNIFKKYNIILYIVIALLLVFIIGNVVNKISSMPVKETTDFNNEYDDDDTINNIEGFQ